MAHVRQDALTTLGSHNNYWNKHLRPYAKRQQAQRERRAAKLQIAKDRQEPFKDQSIL
jgi:hypothetical protein